TTEDEVGAARVEFATRRPEIVPVKGAEDKSGALYEMGIVKGIVNRRPSGAPVGSGVVIVAVGAVFAAWKPVPESESLLLGTSPSSGTDKPCKDAVPLDMPKFVVFAANWPEG